MNHADLALHLRTLADHIDHGRLATALERTDGWTDGPRPGDTHDTPEAETTIAERTANDRRAQHRAAQLRAELDQALERATRAVTTINAIVAIAHPATTNHRPATPADYAGAGYCRSCSRDNGYLQPIATRPDGTRRYRDLCNGCGEWAAGHDGHHPPLEVLRIRHQGRRLTTADYTRIMGSPPRGHQPDHHA